MNDYLKPLPKSDPLTARFWDSVNRENLEIQCCDDCKSFVFYPRGLCPTCGSRSLRWTRVSGRGEIYSLTIVHRPTNAAFKADAPYVVAIVQLEEGCRLMSNIVNAPADPKLVAIGMPVEIVYDRVTQDTVLPKFKLATT
jgi:uncharacterized OB-fold protein